MKTIQRNVLITSISNKVPIIKSIHKATKKIRKKIIVIGADSNSESIGKYFVDKFWVMPKIEELNLLELIKFCKDNSIYWIIPTRDGELSYFAKYKSKLELEDIHVMISGQKSISIGLDKLKFFKTLRNLDFPVIPTYNSLDNLNYERFVVKDRYGSGSNNIGLNLINEEAIQFASKLASPIFQPYIEGIEYSVDLYVSKEQKTKGVILRKRNIIALGESQVTETERDISIELIFSDLAEKLKLYGHVMFQFIKDNNNQIHIIECNCRFGGASNISLDVGLDSFYWFFLESTGEKINQIKFIRSYSEKKMIKYISELII